MNIYFFAERNAFLYLCSLFLLLSSWVQAKPYEASDIYHMAQAQTPIPDDVDINMLTYGNTALHIAVGENNVEAARFLIEYGANVNIKLPLDALHRDSLLHRVQSLEMAQLLLDYGADLNSLESDYRITPIHVAIMHGHQEIVDFFLEQGADLNTGAVKDGDLTYFIAENIVWFLFDTHFGSPIARNNVGERTQPNTLENIMAILPVAHLIQNIFELKHAGYLTLSQSLLMTPFVMVPAGITSILSVDVLQAWESNIKGLLKKLNIPPERALDIPLNVAIYTKNKAMIESFLNKNSDINSKGTSFITPVIATIITYWDNEDAAIEILRLLMEQGADINQYYKAPAFAPYAYLYTKRDELRSFTSALDLTRQLECKKIEAFLLEQGVDTYNEELAAQVVTPVAQAFFEQVRVEARHSIFQSIKKRFNRPKAYATPKPVKKSHPMFGVSLRNPLTQLR